MVAGPLQAAKRALVTVLLLLAQQYGIDLKLRREDPDQLLEAAYRKVVKRVHPDKGGRVADAQKLQAAREEWTRARAKGNVKAGGVHRSHGKALLPVHSAESKPVYKIFGAAVLLAYHGLQQSSWMSFLAFVREKLSVWLAIHWCASMETCSSGNIHLHLMLQFQSASKTRQVDDFCFGASRPNASTTDLCGDGLCRKKWQSSVDRGFFYVFADKISTVKDSEGNSLTAGNYMPCWTDSIRSYQVLGKWPETLWKQRKVATDVYERLLFLTRDGVVSRQRNLSSCREQEQRLAAEAAIEERVKRIRANPEIYRPFPEVPVAQEWLKCFKKDALRYPILVVLGQSRAGKTEWAKSLFEHPLELKIGALTFFPDTLRSFRRGHHDAVILDDVRDLQFLVDHQEKLQGKYDCLVEFGSTAGGTCAYQLDLFGTPVVATINFSTKNLSFLEDHDWLANPGNRVLVQF